MAWYRTKEGYPMHINSGRVGEKKAPLPCMARRDDKTICQQISLYACDWKLGAGGACDNPLCDDHANQVAPDKHLCPDHQVAYAEWKARKEGVQA